MKRRVRIALALSASCAFVVALAGYRWFFWSPDVLLRGHGYEGLLSPAARMHPRFGAWDPTRRMIDDMERALVCHVRERSDLFGTGVLARLPSYRRNYWCVTKNGRRLIKTTFYSPQIVSRRDWLDGTVIQGGLQEDNWSVCYDPDTGQFTNAYPFAFSAVNER